jgi:hypothetical protein
LPFTSTKAPALSIRPEHAISSRPRLRYRSYNLSTVCIEKYQYLNIQNTAINYHDGYPLHCPRIARRRSRVLRDRYYSRRHSHTQRNATIRCSRATHQCSRYDRILKSHHLAARTVPLSIRAGPHIPKRRQGHRYLQFQRLANRIEDIHMPTRSTFQPFLHPQRKFRVELTIIANHCAHHSCHTGRCANQP